MSDQRKGGIAWTEETWNPIRGCSRVSPGCVNCYAERQAIRMSGAGYKGLVDENGRWTGVVRELHGQTLLAPLSWRRPRMVFVNSMSDLFHEALPDEAIDRIFAVMATAHWHTFQVLTKRHKRMHAYARRAAETDMQRRWIAAARAMNIEVTGEFPPKNVWLGVSVENQEYADRRIPVLLDTPAAVRWISAEPLLGPVNLGVRAMNPDLPREYAQAFRGSFLGEGGLDWVVVGGESGPGARTCDLAWVRAVVAQCLKTKTPVFVKQLGAKVVWTGGHGELACRFKDAKAGNPAEWPIDLRIREWPRGSVPA